MEVLTHLGAIIRADPSMLEGMSRVRLHFIIIAIREEISRRQGLDEEGIFLYFSLTN